MRIITIIKSWAFHAHVPTKRPGPVRNSTLGKGCGPFLTRSSPRGKLTSAALSPSGPAVIFERSGLFLFDLARLSLARGLRSLIAVGHLVIAQEAKWDGWWEAIVLARDGDMLTLKWRDYPWQSNVVRHAGTVALLKPSPVST